MLLIGNKTDKKRDVSEAEAKAWASSRDMQYMETSAKDGSGVKQAFEALFTAVCSSGRKPFRKAYSGTPHAIHQRIAP